MVRFRDGLDRRLVNLATVKAYVSPQDLLDAMASNVDNDHPLGEHLVQVGVLNAEQYEELSEMQNPHSLRLFRECLILTDAMKPEATDRALRAFHETAPPPPAPAAAPPEVAPRPAEEVQGVLRNVIRVFTLPTVVQKILSMLDDPASDLRDIARLIESDPSISSQVLRFVNSAMFGMRTKITNVKQAVVTLGTRGTRRLILTTVAAGTFIRLNQDLGRALWTHSIRSATWCHELVTRIDRSLTDDAFTGGILHEIGSVILYQLYPEQMTRIQVLVDGGADPMGSEIHFFGMTHTEVGAFLCRHWGFPPQVTQSVLHHHAAVPILRALPDVPDLTKAVHAACRLADVTAEGLAADPPAGVNTDFLEFHGLTPDVLRELGPQVEKKSQEMISVLF